MKSDGLEDKKDVTMPEWRDGWAERKYCLLPALPSSFCSPGGQVWLGHPPRSCPDSGRNPDPVGQPRQRMESQGKY